MALGGAMLKGAQTGLRLLQLLSSIVILAIFSYFLASLSRHHMRQAGWVKAVEGIAGAAVLWTLVATLLTCFVGGLTAFGALALLLDLLLLGGMVAVAIMTRGGARSCKGDVSTPLGDGNTRRPGPSKLNMGTPPFTPNYKAACRMEKAVFAVSIILIGLFLLTALLQVLLVRHHKKEKRYGPSPANGYTSGSGKKSFFGRKKNTYARDAELATAGTGAVAAVETEKHHHNHIRPSGETGYTGSTMATADHTQPTKYSTQGTQGTVPVTTHAGHDTTSGYVPVAPVNYENTTTTAQWTTPPPRVNY
ncbi:MAG: hypothetical protein M1816_001254 [Peltula sp. TS41687]|nr:MAG: hypothetical protein M1816_001254 [Peltula sp. TS41687]